MFSCKQELCGSVEKGDVQDKEDKITGRRKTHRVEITGGPRIQNERDAQERFLKYERGEKQRSAE